MPSQFEAIKFSLSTAETELTSFKGWLTSKTFVGEREVVAEVRSRRNMCCLLASVGGMPAPDLIKFELTLQGLFRTDLAFGNDATRQFVLIEFEDAREDSIFSGGKNQYRYWSRRLDHGVGQVVDWAWLRADNPNAIVLTNAFGGNISDSTYVVVCGRDASLADEMERRRFEFRRYKMNVEGTPLQILTYDGMVRTMERQLEAGKSFALSP